MSVAFTSCDKEESNTFLSEPEVSAVPNLSAPKLDKYLTTTNYDEGFPHTFNQRGGYHREYELQDPLAQIFFQTIKNAKSK